jgi:transposase
MTAMLTLPDSCRYFLYRPPTDVRKSFYSLAAIVKEQMKGDPMSGDIFIFMNRHRNYIKMLRWEKDGFAIYSKRLERGTFEMPAAQDNGSYAITSQQLSLILQGIALTQIRYRKRYVHEPG